MAKRRIVGVALDVEERPKKIQTRLPATKASIACETRPLASHFGADETAVAVAVAVAVASLETCEDEASTSSNTRLKFETRAARSSASTRRAKPRVGAERMEPGHLADDVTNSASRDCTFTCRKLREYFRLCGHDFPPCDIFIEEARLMIQWAKSDARESQIRARLISKTLAWTHIDATGMVIAAATFGNEKLLRCLECTALGLSKLEMLAVETVLIATFVAGRGEMFDAVFFSLNDATRKHVCFMYIFRRMRRIDSRRALAWARTKIFMRRSAAQVMLWQEDMGLSGLFSIAYIASKDTDVEAHLIKCYESNVLARRHLVGEIGPSIAQVLGGHVWLATTIIGYLTGVDCSRLARHISLS